ncbi:hypothetical protein M758_UG015400 [Ceratodon purpureus]|nr:hypothetical protein M758_UG015400 [Ceratodon purpureus]
MAAFRVHSLAAVGSASHGPVVVSRKGITAKTVHAGNTCTLSLVLKKSGATLGQKRGSVKSSRVRLNCRASNESLGSEENVDISDIVLNSSDMDLSSVTKALKKSPSESAARPPKFTTLRPFGEGGAGVMSGLEGSLFELLAANIQATADLKRFETLSGRMAMMAFFVAIGVEVVTGNSVFKGIDVKELGQFAALSGVAALTAAGFAFAWRARSDVASSLSKGALKLVDAAVDNVIDGLFYDEEEKFKE